LFLPTRDFSTYLEKKIRAQAKRTFPHDNARHFLEKIIFLFFPAPSIEKTEKIFLNPPTKNPHERERGNAPAQLPAALSRKSPPRIIRN